tara:strand:+ start:2620 stop:2955 length:336 start_codon:yes stop_codon:yes gene_type:complete
MIGGNRVKVSITYRFSEEQRRGLALRERCLDANGEPPLSRHELQLLIIENGDPSRGGQWEVIWDECYALLQNESVNGPRDKQSDVWQECFEKHANKQDNFIEENEFFKEDE